jgi:ubiquinone/menaquinone biosynthesis C-methylase UbiE
MEGDVTIMLEPIPHDLTRPLAHADAELHRMVRDSVHLTHHSADFLRRAGLRPGMRVLDVRCRAGDLSVLAARLVGAGGSVVGIDPSADAVATARRHAAAAGLTQLTFAVADPATFGPDQPFDAVIGRFVLMYQRAPAATLRALARHVRPHGIVAFQELDMHRERTAAGSLFEQCRTWMIAAFDRAGADPGLGSALPATFREAGLPPPPMIVASYVDGWSRSPAYRWAAETVRSLLPVIAGMGMATPAEVDADTLEARLRAEALSADNCLVLPTLVGAWTRRGA